MAKYLKDQNNDTLDDGDVDDEYFLRPRSYNNFHNGVSTSTHQQWDLDNRKAELLAKRLEIEDRTVKSTQRTLQHLRNSEVVGVATAEELLHQREQLERTGKSLDDINTTLRFSQRHIQGIKSVFGGLKNLISGKPSMPSPAAANKNKKPSTVEEEPPIQSNKLNEMLEHNKPIKNDLHPALALSDKYVDEYPDAGLYGASSYTSNGPNSDRQEVLNENMEQILDSVKKLKSLASGLGDEIDTQNDLIEGIIGKAERADRSLSKNNKDINKLLK